MAKTAPKSDWETLPTEISISILKQLPDLTTLYNYISSSPAAARIFDTHAVEIVESHLASGTIHAYTCGIIRLAAYVRSGVRPPGVTDLYDFNNLYVHETTQHRYEPPRWTQAPLRLMQQQPSSSSAADDNNTAAVSASALRSVLASQHRSERLVAGCLAMYLPRFQALQPLHLADHDHAWESVYHGLDKTEFVGSWQMQPATVPFPKRDVGAPTWCEEQRLLRAAWRVQLFEDVKAAAVAGRFLERWPDREVQRLQRNDATCLMAVETEDLIEEQSWEPDIHHQFIDVEHELIYTVLDYVDTTKKDVDGSAAVHHDAELRRLPSRQWPAPVPSRRDILEVEWYTSAVALVFQRVYGEEYGHVVEDWCTPLQHVPWDFYRRRGFAIWSEERMLGYGLLGRQFCLESQDETAATTTMPTAATGDENYNINMLFMAWKSVLADEELAEVDRINQKFQEEAMRPSPRVQVGMVSYLQRNITPDIYRVKH